MNPIKSVSSELKSLSNFIKRFADRKLEKLGTKQLTPMQVGVLIFIYNGKEAELFQKDIEEKFSIRRSTATSILKIMEKKNLITRTPVSYDARMKRIKLTPEALLLHDRAESVFQDLESQLTKGIPQEELDLFFDVIEKMKQNMTL